MTRDDDKVVKDLIRIMKATNQEIPDDLYKMNSFNGPSRGFYLKIFLKNL